MVRDPWSNSGRSSGEDLVPSGKCAMENLTFSGMVSERCIGTSIEVKAFPVCRRWEIEFTNQKRYHFYHF